MIKTTTTGLLFLVFFLFTSFVKPDDQEFQINGFAQGTSYHIVYWSPTSIVEKPAIDSIFNQLDSSLSIYKPYSLINKFNNSISGVAIDLHLQKVVQRSIQIFEDTKGSFDITVYPLVKAWGFGDAKIDVLPNPTTISALLPCIGTEKLKLTERYLSKTIPCVKIDVNGIAQGYTVDVIAEYLEKNGVKNYLVEVGGELRVAGIKPNKEAIKIGIESPSANEKDEPILNKVISIPNGAITTSGNYRKYVESGNKRLSHLIDPKTGSPISSDMVSVTVFAKDALTADGYDNPLMAMNISQAIAFIEHKKDIEAYFIYHQKDGKLADTATAGFYRFFIKVKD